MIIKVADSAGFCPGVRSAVNKARRMLEEQHVSPVMLGEIVHNRDVVDELEAGGFELASSAADCPEGAEVLIRAHGISREERAVLEQKNCIISDCTCGWVREIQKLAQRSVQQGKQFILCGTKRHPEVIGIVSAAEGKAIVLQGPDEIDKEVLSDVPTVLCAQTTFSVQNFEKISKILKEKIAKLEIFDTLCSTTVQRQTEAEKLASESDVVFVLGSENSSNTNKLLEVCRSVCRDTYLIQRPDQVPELIEGRDLRQLRIGITAGASTPERMIREVIHVMTENQVFSNEQEAKEELNQQTAEEKANEENKVEFSNEPAESGKDEQKEFSFADFIDGIPQLKRGAVVKGTIVRYDDEFVYVDVRDKSEGKVPRHEFQDDPDFDLDAAVAEHREIEVFVRNIRNSDMGKEIVLSKAKVDFNKHKEAIEKAFEEKRPVTVKVTNVVKDGVIASYGSVDLYIHRTQLDLNIVEDLDAYRGQTIEVLITQFDPNRKRLRVSGSRRSLLARDRKQKAKDLWDSIEVGKEYDGTVRNLTDFGAFVDIGGVDGLVHISELSWKRIKHPSEVVSVGDKLHVFVKEFDPERRRISLGYRRPENDPYYNIEQRFPMGSIVRGIVVRMFPFGAFVEIAPGVDALCHISQISNYRLNRPEDVLQEGMEVDARVLEVSDEARKISISIKEVEPIDPENPEESQLMQRPEKEEREERQPRRRPRREQEEQEDKLPTAYTDNASGSSLSALADFTVASKEGAEVLKSLGLDEAVEDKVEE